MKGTIQTIIPTGIQYSDFRVVYKFNNDSERLEAFTKAEADLAYYYRIGIKNIEEQKAGDAMEKEYNKKASFAEVTPKFTDRQRYVDWKNRKEGK